MAIILNIESATDICSIGLSQDREVISLIENHEGNVHSEKITLLITECMQKVNMSLEKIDAIALSSGPGSYTSLRVGSAVAKGICYALNKPLISVNTLRALAWGSFQKEQLQTATYIPMIDARRMEVYMAIYDTEQKQLVDVAAKILNDETLSEWSSFRSPLVVCGSGMEKSKTVLTDSNVIFSEVLCSATYLVNEAYHKFKNKEFENMAYFSPIYFKAPNITVSKKKTL